MTEILQITFDEFNEHDFHTHSLNLKEATYNVVGNTVEFQQHTSSLLFIDSGTITGTVYFDKSKITHAVIKVYSLETVTLYFKDSKVYKYLYSDLNEGKESYHWIVNDLTKFTIIDQILNDGFDEDGNNIDHYIKYRSFNNMLHSVDDLPAKVETKFNFIREEWYFIDKLHRVGKPAVMQTVDGQYTEEFWEYGVKLH